MIFQSLNHNNPVRISERLIEFQIYVFRERNYERVTGILGWVFKVLGVLKIT